MQRGFEDAGVVEPHHWNSRAVIGDQRDRFGIGAIGAHDDAMVRAMCAEKRVRIGMFEREDAVDVARPDFNPVEARILRNRAVAAVRVGVRILSSGLAISGAIWFSLIVNVSGFEYRACFERERLRDIQHPIVEDTDGFGDTAHRRQYSGKSVKVLASTIGVALWEQRRAAIREESAVSILHSIQ